MIGFDTRFLSIEFGAFFFGFKIWRVYFSLGFMCESTFENYQRTLGIPQAQRRSMGTALPTTHRLDEYTGLNREQRRAKGHRGKLQ